MAIFAYGLKEDARIWKKIAGTRNVERELLVSIYDNLNWLVWSRTEDGANNRNKPESLYKKLYGKDESQADEVNSFATPEDFKKHWEEIRRRHGYNS